MKKFLIIILIFIPVLTIQMYSAELAELGDISRPSIFIVNNNKVYIMEDASVFIYDLKNFKLLKKFGKAGEGPKEFKYDANDGRPMSMSFYKGQLIVNSTNKMSFFDLDGNYLSEKKIPVDRILFPVQDKYLGIGPTMDKEEKKQFLGFTLYSNDFKSTDVVFLSDFEMSNTVKIFLPMTTYTYNPVYKNKIYINSSSDAFRIVVKDVSGKVLSVIEKDYPKIKVPGNFREEALEYFRTSPRFKRAFEFVKKVLKIREYYPQIRDIQIVDDHIYVLTFKRQGELWELIKFDLKGTEKGRKFIPLTEYELISFYPVFYSIYKDKVYSLLEDEDEETWKVHVTEFK